MKKIIFLFWLCFLGACAKAIEVNSEKAAPPAPAATKAMSPSLNKAKIERQENVVEVHQEFQIQNGKNEWQSSIHSLEINDISFVRMSAFSLDKGSDYRLHFRIYEEEKWGEWTVLPESREQANPNRKVFDGLNLFQDIDKIQFKSNQATQSPVVFRLFIAKNQN